MQADAVVENHGSICLVRPISPEASEWLHEHTEGQWFGQALAVEPRYVDALVEGMVGDGLEVM